MKDRYQILIATFSHGREVGGGVGETCDSDRCKSTFTVLRDLWLPLAACYELFAFICHRWGWENVTGGLFGT